MTVSHDDFSHLLQSQTHLFFIQAPCNLRIPDFIFFFFLAVLSNVNLYFLQLCPLRLNFLFFSYCICQKCKLLLMQRKSQRLRRQRNRIGMKCKDSVFCINIHGSMIYRMYLQSFVLPQKAPCPICRFHKIPPISCQKMQNMV